MSDPANGVPAAKRQKLEIPEGLGDDHPPIVLYFRPEGKTAAPKQLEYYCLQGLGEVARMLLEVTQTPYDSIMHFTDAFKAYAPFGQLPLYRGDEISGIVLAQSGTICRHIAKMVGANGSGPAEQAQVDSLFELSMDIFGTKGAVRAPNGDDAGRFVMYMKAAEKHAPSSSNGFWVGTSLTLADVAMFQILYQLFEMQSDCLDAYPKLQAFTNAFMKPAIKAYLESDRRIPLTLKEKRLPFPPRPALKAKGLPYEGWAGYTYTTPLRPSVVAELYKP